MVLKKYVRSSWSISEKCSTGMEPTSKMKEYVGEVLMKHGLCDPEPRMRSVCAHLAAQIARVSIDEFPIFFEYLLVHLRQGSLPGVHGAIHVLAEYAREDLTEQQLQQFGNALFTDLLHILQATDKYPISVRCRTLAIMRDIVSMMHNLKDSVTDVESFLKTGLYGWLQVIMSIMQTNFESLVESENALADLLHLKMAAMKLIRSILVGFPKLLDSNIVILLECAWNDMNALLTNFVRDKVNGGGELISYADSDGDSVDTESYLFSVIEFFEFFVRHCKYAPLLVGSDAATKKLEYLQKLAGRKNLKKNKFFDHATAQQGGILTQLMPLLIAYMQMTDEQMEQWVTDPNQYVLDEMEQDTFSQSIRIVALDLITLLVDDFGDYALSIIMQGTAQTITKSKQDKLQGLSNWWKLQDAALLCLGRLSQEILTSVKGQKLSSDIVGLFDHVILEAIQCEGECRALWFAGQFSSALPTHLATQYLSMSVHALNFSQSVPVRISALNTLKSFSEQLKPKNMADIQGSVIEAVVSLAPHVNDATLTLLLETLASVIKINEQTTLRYSDTIITLVLNIWSNNTNDQHISGLATDLLETLASMPQVYSLVLQRCLPAIETCIASYDSDKATPVVASAIELLTGIIKHTKYPLPRPLVESAFPRLMQLLLSSTESAILQNGQECLKYYAAVDLDALLQWTDNSTGQTGLHFIMHLISRVLQPQADDAAGFFIGSLITKLISKGGSALTPILPELLTAMLQRLRSAKNPTVIQSLLVVFAQLVRTQCEALVDFLCNLNIDNQNGLEILLRSWVDNHASLHGSYEIKVSALALTKLYQLPNSRVHNVMVIGSPIIAGESDRIVTRSRAKTAPQRYTSVPFRSKIFTLLCADLMQNYDGIQGNAEGEQDESDDDESGFATDDGDDDHFETVHYNSNTMTSLQDHVYLSDAQKDTEFDLDEYDENDSIDDETDPNRSLDPIQALDLQDILLAFFKETAIQDPQGFNRMTSEQLQDKQQMQLQRLLSN